MIQKVTFSILVVALMTTNQVWTQSPSMVQNVNPNGDGFAEYITGVGSDVFFRATNASFGSELWKYNGDTAVVVDIIAGDGSSNPVELTALGAKLLFSANDNINGRELWIYNGDSVDMVKDIYPGSTGASPEELTVYNNEVYFRAKDGSKGSELWKYDGNTAVMVADINSGFGSSLPLGLKVVGSFLYFMADDGIHGRELFRYDGDSAILVQDINDGFGTSLDPDAYFTGFGADLYFAATDGVNGKELWKYDGDTAVLVHNINPLGDANPEHLIALDTILYFTANDSINGSELWRYDGETLEVVEDINPGPDSSDPSRLTIFNSELYFAAHDGVNPLTLWKTDGDTAFVVASDPSDFSDPNFMTVFQDKLYFTVNTMAQGLDLVEFDGNTLTHLDLHPGPNPSAATNFAVLGCNLYFEARDNDANGKELWVLPGSNNNVTQDGNQLTAQAIGVAYQWFNCNTNQPVAGATGRSFVPNQNGTYAVEITQPGCTVMSACFNVTVVGLEDEFENAIKVFPTIAENKTTIDLGKRYQEVLVIVRNLNGQVISRINPQQAIKRLEIELPKSKGLYFIEIEAESIQPTRFKVIRK